MRRFLVLALAFALPACDRTAASAPDRREPAAARPAAAPADHARPPAERAAHGTAGDPCSKAHPEGGMVMPWIADDLPSALACAQQRGVPIVVDEWAPWCHTCLSMQSTVFTDASFKPEVDRFVFAALDTDKEANAAAVAKYPPSAWPTFYVIGRDATTGAPDAVLARFVGAASLAQFHSFLDAGRKALQGGAAGADAHLLGAERAIAVKDFATAEQELTAALGQAPADWPRRPDALVSVLQTKRKRKDLSGCLDVADRSLDQTGNAAAATDFIVQGMLCTEALIHDAAAAPRIQRLRERSAARLTSLLADPHAPLSVDDRSDALANLRELQGALGKHDQARATAEKQRALLDDAAGKAATPMAAMTYNWQRCDVYTYLGRPLDMVPALEKSVHDLPGEYDPRARLGWIYLQAGKLTEAAKWTDEALAMVYGPRKAKLLGQRVEIATKQHDRAAQKRYLQQTVQLWTSLPPGQDNPEALAKAKDALNVALTQPD
ncbi:MAG TPA: thioredoxin family protein [Kofleriaceae bacterium]|jgi:thioredoxin-like negative regulator of GroEL|nr:thioredoxin family protein [Kofleriaceae bacterium]